MDGPSQTAESAQDILRLYLAADDEHQARLLLERLIQEHADPVVKAVVRRKMGVHLDYTRRLDQVASDGIQAGPKRSVELDAEDVHASSVLNLLEHLWALRGSGQADDTIQDFRAYVGRISLNAFAMHMRQRFPERHRLRRKLWYLTKNHSPVSGFALWQGQDSDEQIYGFRDWEGRPTKFTGNYQRWQQDPSEFQAEALAGRDPRGLSFPKLVAQILNWVEAPMNMDDMVNGLVQLLGVREINLVDE